MQGGILGARPLDALRARFVVWAPAAGNVEVHLVSPGERIVPLHRIARGYYRGVIEGVTPGARYFYRLNGTRDLPDPASRFQPEGVAGPSQVIDPASFPWTDRAWKGWPHDRLILYELHVGVFTAAGTFEAVIPHLDRLCALGVTAVELMPVAQFPGDRNWGYDAVFPFAPQHSYGGATGLQRLVDACHRHGLAVFLDVVYNHVGPEGNVLAEFGPYFTQRYRTPWGQALNFDGPRSDHVRRLFIESALHWVRDYHVDGLRLDAVHAIVDASPMPFLEALGAAVRKCAAALSRHVHVIAETSQNDPRVIQPQERGGFGLNGQWNDDFHHALHALLTGERAGYYGDHGRLAHLARALRRGYVYTGQYSAFRGRSHGRPPEGCRADQFVVYAQNHDQVGNRPGGDRLSTLVDFEALKLAAAVVLLSPFVPLLFMGEEYGETAPFLYFTSLADRGLGAAVRRGRQAEFKAFGWQGEIPDPQDLTTFLRSRLDQNLRGQGHHRLLEEYYRELIRLRRDVPAFGALDFDRTRLARRGEDVLVIHRWTERDAAAVVLSFSPSPRAVAVPVDGDGWTMLLNSRDPRWGGPLGGRGGAPDDAVASAGAVTSVAEAGREVVLRLAPWSAVVLHRSETR